MRKTYDSKFKSRVALEAMRGELTIAEIASKYQVHPNQVQSWKKRLHGSPLHGKPHVWLIDESVFSRTIAGLIVKTMVI